MAEILVVFNFNIFLVILQLTALVPFVTILLSLSGTPEKGREFMSMPNGVMLVTKQLVDSIVDELLDRDRLSFICLVDDPYEFVSLTCRLNHDAGYRDLLYNLHLIDVETYHSISNILDEYARLLDEYAREIEKQYSYYDEFSDESDDELLDSDE